MNCPWINKDYLSIYLSILGGAPFLALGKYAVKNELFYFGYKFLCSVYNNVD